MDPSITDEQCAEIVAVWRETMQPKNAEQLTEVQAASGGVSDASGGGVGGGVETVVAEQTRAVGQVEYILPPQQSAVLKNSSSEPAKHTSTVQPDHNITS